MKDDGVKLTLESRGKMDWLGMAKVVGAAVGIMGGGAGLLSMTRPDAASADNEKIAAIAKGVTDAQAAATSAEKTAWDAQDKATQARRDIDALAATVAAQTKALERTNDKLDAQAAQLNQVIGMLRGMK